VLFDLVVLQQQHYIVPGNIPIWLQSLWEISPNITFISWCNLCPNIAFVLRRREYVPKEDSLKRIWITHSKWLTILDLIVNIIEVIPMII
jgi:hypothetical protein